MKRVFSILILAAFLPILMLNSSALAQTAANKPVAPNFSLRDLDGKRIELKEFLKKGPVLLDFWALWCIPCLKALPYLEKIYQHYKDQGLIVLAINEDDPSNEAKVKPFVKGKRYSFIVAVDKDREVWRKFKLVSLPTSFLIDEEGRIQKTHLGYRPGDEKQLEKEVKELLLTPINQ